MYTLLEMTSLGILKPFLNSIFSLPGPCFPLGSVGSMSEVYIRVADLCFRAFGNNHGANFLWRVAGKKKQKFSAQVSFHISRNKNAPTFREICQTQMLSKRIGQSLQSRVTSRHIGPREVYEQPCAWYFGWTMLECCWGCKISKIRSNAILLKVSWHRGTQHNF